MIYFTSDLHFCHAREFVYKPRGFDSVQDMNKMIVHNWNNVVNPDDDVYVLGDIMLNNDDEGLRLLKSLKGHIHIIIGNHDTDTRVEKYKECWNVVEVCYATIIKHNGYRFYLSHYPTFTGVLEKPLKKNLLNLYGHTHQVTRFYEDIPFMYNVGVDSHDCIPVRIDDVIAEMKLKEIECKKML